MLLLEGVEPLMGEGMSTTGHGARSARGQVIQAEWCVRAGRVFQLTSEVAGSHTARLTLCNLCDHRGLMCTATCRQVRAKRAAWRGRCSSCCWTRRTPTGSAACTSAGRPGFEVCWGRSGRRCPGPQLRKSKLRAWLSSCLLSRQSGSGLMHSVTCMSEYRTPIL